MNFFYLFVITFILINPIFNCILFAFGVHSESGQLQIAYILMFTLTIFFILKQFFRRPIKFNLNSFYIIVLILSITFFFFLTRFYYSVENTMYESEFLCWGASSLPALLCGSMYATKPLRDLHKKLPFFILPLTIIISYVSFTTIGRTSGDRILDEATGMNYQSIAYYTAQLFGLTIFCILVERKRHILINLILYALLIVQFITCFFSGGRGGLVLLILYLLLFLYKKIQLQKNNIISITSIILSIVLFIFIIQQFNIFNTAGFYRLLETFHQGDSNRAILQAAALQSFYDSPIWGHGIGSIFFEIGTYSHNFITDIMVELGIIGLILILVMLAICMKFLIKNANNYNSLFITIIFIYALTLNTFSGYWLANHLLWFVFGYIISIRKINLGHNIYG